MNTLVDHRLRTMGIDSREVESSEIAKEYEKAERARKKLFDSLRKRWWYYSIITLLAGGIGYFTAIDYGSYKFKASSVVGAKSIPFPPGQSFYTPPNIEEFVKYLLEPGAADASIGPQPGRVLEHELDQRAKVITVRFSSDQPESAAEIVNKLIDRAIEESTEQRVKMLSDSLRYFRSLVERAEAEASVQRQAKVESLSRLRRKLLEEGNPQLQFEELTEIVRLQRSELSVLESELKDSERLLKILEEDEQELVSKTHDELKADCLHQIQLMAQQFTAKSVPASDLERKAEAVKSIATKGMKSRDDLTDWLRSVEVASRIQLTIPADYEEVLDRLVESQYNLKNRLLLLPEKIEETKRKLAQATQQRGLLKVSDEFDFDTIPEVQELNILIARAEQNADQIASAIAWIEDLQTLDTPAFEQLVPASAESAIPDGNHQKLFALAFGLTGLLLGFPVLLIDFLYSPMTAAQRLGNELGLATIPTHEIMSRASVSASLQVGDPELRLLALRIQQMAREARGSVVLFSSLADHVSTKELTTTLAQCLAARQEKVLMIDLESIEENRMPKAATRRLKVSANSDRSVVVASSASAHGHGVAPSTLSEERVSDGDHSLSGGGKMGLAVALSGGAKVPEDVRIEHGDDGVDRVLLGPGDLAVEAFATPLMAQLLDTYRSAYSMVLLSGPAAKHLADVQMLAARCDGTLFVAPEKGELTQTARRTILELRENRRVILGLAVVPA
jgi:Mrp family chromosome partitioning ATPase